MVVERTYLARRSVMSRFQRGRSRFVRWGQTVTAAGVIAANTLLCWTMSLWPNNVPFSAYVPVAVLAGLSRWHAELDLPPPEPTGA